MKKNTLVMVLYDFLFLAVSFLIAITAKYILDKKAAPLEAIGLSDITALTQSEMTATAGLLEQLWIILIAVLAISIFLLLLNWTFFQGLVYKTLDNKKLRLKFFLRFFVLNLVWFSIITMILSLIYILSNKNFINPATISIIIVFIHFTNILYTIFEQDSRPRAIRKTFAVGIVEFYKFILPYIAVFALFFAISYIRLLSNIIPSQIVGAIYLILILLILSFLRNYVHTLINEVE